MYNQGAAIAVEREKPDSTELNYIYSHIQLNRDGGEVVPLQLLKTHYGFKLLKEWTDNRNERAYNILYYSALKTLMLKARSFFDDYDDALGVVHEAFRKANSIISRGKLKKEGNFLAYILTIVKNEAINLLGKKERDPQYIGGLPLDEVTGDSCSSVSELEGHWILDYSTLDGLDEKMGMEIVEQLLPLIDETRRDVFQLRYINCVSVKETASITGKPLGTVLSQSKRARDDIIENMVIIDTKKLGLEEMVDYYTR